MDLNPLLSEHTKPKIMVAVLLLGRSPMGKDHCPTLCMSTLSMKTCSTNMFLHQEKKYQCF